MERAFRRGHVCTVYHVDMNALVVATGGYTGERSHASPVCDGGTEPMLFLINYRVPDVRAGLSA